MNQIDPKTLMDCDLPVLDVRTPGEFASGHAPGSVNLPLDRLEAERERIAARLAGPVAIMCASGRRAERARQALAAAGYSGALAVSDGIGGWEAAGGKVNATRQLWSMERQVRFTAGMLVALGALASFLWAPAAALAAFVGGGLMFAAVTDTCGMALVLGRMPWNRGAPACDLEAAMARLAQDVPA